MPTTPLPPVTTTTPTIKINSGTGSDTQASGAGPSTLITGTLAATHTNTTVNITDAVNLGGVAIDGTAALWVASSSGRRWSKITGISGSSGAWVVTVGDAYANTESGKTWGIGGKRAGLDNSTQLGYDIRAGWVIDIQTDLTITANFVCAPNVVSNLTTYFSSTSGTRPTITTSTNSIFGIGTASSSPSQGANSLVISNIHFKSTAGTPGTGIGQVGLGAASVYITVSDCVVEGFATGIKDSDAGSNNFTRGFSIENTEVKSCGTGVDMGFGARLTGCYIHGCTTKGLNVVGTGSYDITLNGCIFDSNAFTGADLAPANLAAVVIDHCDFTNTTTSSGIGAGLRLNYSQAASTIIRNSIFYGNSIYGISAVSTNIDPYFVTTCAFGSNATADAQSPATTGDNPLTLTANPFNSSSDFGLNSTAGGGAVCRGAATAMPNATANTAGDVGAIPSGGGAAASTGATAFAF